MELPINQNKLIVTLGAVSVSMYVAENLIPFPLPWIRIGLGNTGIVIALYTLGFKGAFMVMLLKVFVGSLLSGRFLTLFFIFSLSGSVAASLSMGLFKRFLNPIFGVVGISIIGALTHNLTQLVVAYLLVVREKGIFYLLPILLILGAISGAFVGTISKEVIKKLRQSNSP